MSNEPERRLREDEIALIAWMLASKGEPLTLRRELAEASVKEMG